MCAAEPTRPAGGAARAVAALLLFGCACLVLAVALLTGHGCPQVQRQGQQGSLQRQGAPGPQQGGLPWQPLAAYYQAFARPRAVREALRLFRQHYPDARVLVVNDGGDPSLAGVVAPFNVSYQRRPSITSTGKAGGFHVSQGCNSTAACREFVLRLVEAAAGADWLLLLEDDIHVLRPLSLHQMRHDINQGGHVGGPFSKEFRAAIERLRGRPRREPNIWRGAGGSVFRGSALRALAAEWDDAWLPPLLALNDGMLPVDKLLTSLIFIRGGTHGSWPGYAWLGYRDHDELVAKGLAELVHGNKTLYDTG